MTASKAKLSESVAVLCINLASRPDRRLEMQRKLDLQEIDFDFAEGVQGSLKEYEDFPFYDRERRHKYFYDLTKGECGCAEAFCLSFKRFMSAGDHEFLLLLEDDATLPDNFKALINTFVSDRTGWDCIRLQRSRKQYGITVETIEGYDVKYPLMVGMNNTGLLIRREAVQKVIPLFEKHIYPADHILKFAHFKGVMVYEVNPDVLIQDKSFDSDTKTEQKPFREGLSYFRKLEVKVQRIVGQGLRLFLMPKAFFSWKKSS